MNGSIFLKLFCEVLCMHTLLHYGVKLVFVLIIAILFAFMVSIRPGGKRPSRPKFIGLLVLGVVIALIFLTTQSLYEVQTTV